MRRIGNWKNKEKNNKFKAILIERKKVKNTFKFRNINEIKFIKCIKIIILICLLFIFLLITKKIFNNNNNNNLNNNNYKNKYNYFSCFVGMARQENKYIREYIDYYLKLGVEKFIFADNNLPNTEKLSDVIQDYIDKGTVEIIEIFGSNLGQSELYNSTYEKYKTKCEWFLFFDLDEYLEVFFEKNKKLILKEFLPNEIFDECESIIFNWLIYSDNDLLHYDTTPLNKKFTQPLFDDDVNRFVKAIVRGNLNKTIFLPEKSNHMPEPGVVICDPMGKIDENYDPFSLSPPVFDHGYLKHFLTKTAEEYCNKIKKGAPRNVKFDINEKVMEFFQHNKFNEHKLKIFERIFNTSFDSVIELYKNKL